MSSEEYLAKLKDPRWQKKRLQILERDGWRCQQCCDSKSTLVVHHRSYRPGAEPWDYPNDWLVTLCQPCHEKEITQRTEAESELLAVLRRTFLLTGLRTLTGAFNGIEIGDNDESLAEALFDLLQTPAKRNALIDTYWCGLQDLAKTYAKSTRG